MRQIQKNFYLPESGLYAHSITKRRAEFMWGNGIMFSALIAAARHDRQTWLPIVSRFFTAMDRYWDRQDTPPGYEPFPTQGGGHDKYYDDNAWMVLALCEAYETTHDRTYLQRANETLDFVLSGWDEQRGGGIWWHEGHKSDSKNTCVNAPAAVGCLRLAKYLPSDEAQHYRAAARKIVEWTTRTFDDNGLYSDNINVGSGNVQHVKLTYNTALMIRAYLQLYRASGNPADLASAERSSRAAEWFLDKSMHAYRDLPKWSHLLVEADLEMYRANHDPALMQRAVDNANALYDGWKNNPPDSLIDNAAIARTLWLMADLQSETGRQFWERMDQP
jgi:uncharacterized protein YyaL (SSP411 family)